MTTATNNTDTRPETIDQLKQIDTVPVVIANNQGQVTYINQQFEQVLGWSEAELLGELMTIFLPSSFKDSHNLAFSRFQASEKANVLNHPLELKTLKKSGEAIITEHYIIAEKIDSIWYFGAMLTPLP